jgi:hypothetical protein
MSRLPGGNRSAVLNFDGQPFGKGCRTLNIWFEILGILYYYKSDGQPFGNAR